MAPSGRRGEFMQPSIHLLAEYCTISPVASDVIGLNSRNGNTLGLGPVFRCDWPRTKRISIPVAQTDSQSVLHFKELLLVTAQGGRLSTQQNTPKARER